jgi:hypothetical protein
VAYSIFISLEQASRDENVNEFLKLCANADRQQQIRLNFFLLHC